MLYNYGSINIDHVYRVPHLVRPGETLASHAHSVGLGGKGANQSLALARAGGQVTHWGNLNVRDRWARDLLADAGVKVGHVNEIDGPSGHAIIQVDDQAENSILLFPGANHIYGRNDLNKLIADTASGDWLLLQNECSGLADAIELAHEAGLKIAFNPAPMSDAVRELPLQYCDLLFVNKGEAAWLAGVAEDVSAQQLLDALDVQLPGCQLVLTLGGEGAWYQHDGQRHFQPALPVKAVDTTAAGDTFIGYYLAAMQEEADIPACLALAATAAALGVQRSGAADSIPFRAEVDDALNADRFDA
ncbi:ribokinase [Halomonas binhaiensis]|uniref:Ribokinase n=1 Tax=Halomonas binhaiensis TaxID=2562282 RepID=A0A5C1NI04_9GAMM|nr:ribokinase [Halomonas binhaiensis]QEM81867.1 ribokinase [Halomonas binhaiensis]